MTDKQYWKNLHDIYKGRDWLNYQSIFAEQAISYFPKGGYLLDLGAGQGQDSRYFADHGFKVVSTDIEDQALAVSKQKLSDAQKPHVAFKVVDLSHTLPFADEQFDIVYSHLALHYFSEQTTAALMNEIHRVLKPNAILALLVNSSTDPEYGQGKQIEHDYFEIQGAHKRYFTVNSTAKFTENGFDAILCDDHGETYKDIDKGVHNLIRYVGRKK